MKSTGYAMLLLSAFLWLACSTETDDMQAPDPVIPENPINPENPDISEPEKFPINITTVLAAIETRLTDNVFEYGDRIGLYVADRDADGNPATLFTSGNHVDNMRFTYDSGTWVPATPIYWLDNTTHADFFLYYPYTISVEDVRAMPFRALVNQSTNLTYMCSDLLLGSTLDVVPSENAVGIGVKHVMSQVQITIEPGFGFTAQGLAASQISVSVDRVKSECTVDMTTATVTPTGKTVSVTPLKDGNTYKALIVPQTVAEGSLITVTVDGCVFHFNKAFTFESGKLHKFTVTLSRMNDGMNVGIGSWEDDGTDNGGEAEYIYNRKLNPIK